MEAALVPSQLLGELFVEKGLISHEELEEALSDQKVSGKRLGEILVQKGFVSGPALTTVLAEQLGVEMETQDGFGSGLWSEIKRRHLRTRVGVDGQVDETYEDREPAPDAPDLRLAVIDGLREAVQEPVPMAAADPQAEAPDGELQTVRQQLAFAAARLDEERAAHDGTRRLLEDARVEAQTRAQEAEDWRERAARAEDVDQQARAATELAALDEVVTELRAELAARTDELAESADQSAALASENSRLEAALEELRAERQDVIRQLDEAQARATASDKTVAGLRSELSRHEAAAATHATALEDLRAELTAREAARAREAEACVALERELAEVRSNAHAVGQQLEEARAAHVSVRSDASRLEARCAELEPLAGRLAEAEAEIASRTEKLAALAAELEAVHAELAERPAAPPVEEQPASHIVFLPRPTGYQLVERHGPPPEVGTHEDLAGVAFLVTRIGRSPLPADRRRCAILEVA